MSHLQVVLTQRLLERVPDAVMFLIAGHLLSAAQQQFCGLLLKFRSKQQMLEQQLERNKRSLQPGMLHPNRYGGTGMRSVLLSYSCIKDLVLLVT